SIAGCMYRVVQTTGPDGKNLLKLLPISKSAGSFVPIVQSSALPNNSKANISSPVHLTFKTQLADTTAPSSVKIPIFPSPNPRKIILKRTLDNQEGIRAGSEKESLVPKSAPNTQSSCVSVSVHTMAVTSSSDQCQTTYMFMNSKSLPVPTKSPMLPSGHHLQIPADAEVKSVPASLLPPAIQQKILTAAATNTSGGAGSTKPPTVIYVSPVNTVKTVLPKRLQAICPKPTVEASNPSVTTAAQKGNCSETAASEGKQAQGTPMKWVVQEGPQSSSPCLIPVKSSNNVASKILKTLSDMKNAELNSSNIFQLSSSGAGGSQTKITPLKDNALVMYNGKVYLLTKRDSDVLKPQADKQAPSSSEASLKKGTSKLIDSTAVNKITNEVVNLVLSKSKGIVLSPKDPKPDTNSNSSSPTVLKIDFKSAPATPMTPSATQQDSTVNQQKSLPFTKESSGVTAVPAAGTEENRCQNGKEKIYSHKAARAVLPQPEQECTSIEDRQKIQCEKKDSPEEVIQIEHQEKSHWKQYLELRKKFGLFKEERVYLKKIPSCEKQEERVCSSNSLERRSDSCSSSSDVVIINEYQECVKEEKVNVDLEEDSTKKRKVKSSPQSDSRKRRKTTVTSTPSPASETTSSSVPHSSASPTPVSLQQSVPTNIALSSPGSDSEQGPDSQYSDSNVPVLVSSEGNTSVLEGSFRDDSFLLTPPDLDETIRDEKINRLKQLLKERGVALEKMRRKMQLN
ncbi:LRIF1 factor, partial [Geococcyx californianus]|nr:LRIF1 factor [Geococcyx californianus]